MDVVLELADTFLFDQLYAKVLPISPSITSFDPISTISASWKGYNEANATWDGYSSGVGGGLARSSWQFQPASGYLSVQPGEAAYMSRWDRDNIWRQFVSLYILTW